jgi:hypothetical protein
MRSVTARTATQTMYDGGSGDRIGPFRGRDVAAGPLLAYTFKSGPKRSPSAAGGFMSSARGRAGCPSEALMEAEA